jgi:hypothetical protein
MDVFESLAASPGALRVSAADVEALFTRDDAVHALFFAGERDRSGESADVAVVLRELVRCHAGRLRAATMAPADEKKLKLLFGVSTTPTIVFLRGRTTLAVVERMKNWSQYAAVVDALMGNAAAA